MARHLQILPGFGSRYTSEVITGAASPGAVGADELDMSRCSQFAVQVSSVTNQASSVLQVEQSLDGVHWAALGATITTALGTISRFSMIGGPYALIRLKVIDAAAAVLVTFTIVGYETQSKP